MAVGVGSKRAKDFTPARAMSLAATTFVRIREVLHGEKLRMGLLTDLDAEAFETRDEHVRRLHPSHGIVTEDVSGHGQGRTKPQGGD